MPSDSRGLMPMSRRDMEDLRASLRDGQKYIASRRDPSSPSTKKDLTKVGLEALEVGAGALGVGYLAGRTGTASLGGTGIPLGLLIGAAGHTLAITGVVPSRLAGHVQNVSNGAIAGWLALWGAARGSESRGVAGQPSGPIVAGEAPSFCAPASPPPALPPAPAPGTLNEAELAAIAMNARRAG